jgi:hypothetical protein
MPSRGVLDACDEAGMSWRAEHAPDGVAWSGREQVAHLRGCDDWEAAHELAHWLIASEERRRLDEFGGGPGQFTREGTPLVVVLTEREAVEDEQLAQAMTVAILAALGIDEHLRRYGTLHMGTLALDWAELRRRGHLTEGNAPAFMGDGVAVSMPGPSGPTWLPAEDEGISWWSARA